jgi:fatty acid desaturase
VNVQARAQRIDPIPGALNLALATVAPAAALGLLVAASYTASWGWRIGAALAFSCVNNTLFALLHEAVHGHVHAGRTVNEAICAGCCSGPGSWRQRPRRCCSTSIIFSGWPPAPPSAS